GRIELPTSSLRIRRPPRRQGDRARAPAWSFPDADRFDCIASNDTYIPRVRRFSDGSLQCLTTGRTLPYVRAREPEFRRNRHAIATRFAWEWSESGAPEEIRTPDPQIRSLECRSGPHCSHSSSGKLRSLLCAHQEGRICPNVFDG